ncbi:MAG: hypothetical protein F4Z28_05100 [Gammaproteobacteria bacterium]|nr:hypothetical protein [Gammaproteobacteria bacterium]
MGVVQFVPFAQVEVQGSDLGQDWVRVADASDDLGYVAAAGSQDLEIGISDTAADDPGSEIAAYEAKQASMTIWQIERGKYVWIRATGGSNQTYVFRGWRAGDGIPPWL